MAYFLFAIGALEKRNEIHIIDLEQTILMMRRAFDFIVRLHKNRGYLLCTRTYLDIQPSEKHRYERIPFERNLPQALFLGFDLFGPRIIPLAKEAMKLRLPIIAILDSNSEPFGIQYPIPGNDDSKESIHLYLK